MLRASLESTFDVRPLPPGWESKLGFVYMPFHIRPIIVGLAKHRCKCNIDENINFEMVVALLIKYGNSD